MKSVAGDKEGAGGYQPAPREVFQALREAFVAANGRLMGASIEEIAEQLIVGGHLQTEPPLALVADVLDILEAGGLGIRSPSLHMCGLEASRDADEGQVSSNIDLSWSLEWPGAPTFVWERQGVPDKLTHTKTPPCTDLISEPEAALRDKGRWPIHVCSTEFMSQSTARWALAQPFVSDSLNVYRWASIHPLPIGRQALMACHETEELSEWSDVLNALPFDGDEKAMWALRIERRESATVNTLDLFGLAEYETYPVIGLWTVAGKLAFSMRGQDRSLVDLVDAAEKWWSQFRGLPLKGRPPGTGTWNSRENFVNALNRAMAKTISDGNKVTQEKVAEILHTDDRQLRTYLKRFGINWQEARGT